MEQQLAQPRTAPDDLATPGPHDSAMEARRWRLLARLADALTAAGSDCGLCATAAAELIASELGDVALVVILDPPGHGAPVVGVGLRDPAGAGVIDEQLARATPADLRRLCEAIAAFDVPVLSEPPPGNDTDWHVTAYRSYVERMGVSGAAFAALRRDGTPLGVVVCARAADSPRFSVEDLSAVGAAADRLSLLLDAMNARAAEQWAQHQARLAFEIAPIGMGVMGSDGRIWSVNGAACTLFGRTAEELVGHRWKEFTHSDDIGGEQHVLDRLLSGPVHTGVVTKRVVRPSGEVRWAQITVTLVPDRQGRPDAFHSQLLDITERLAAERRAERFAALVQSSPDFVAIAALDGAVEFLNAAGRELIGMPADVDVAHTTITDYLTPEGMQASAEVEQPAVRSRGAWRGTTTLRDWRDDSAIPVAVTSFLVPDPLTGEPSAMATVQRDIRGQLAAGVALEDLAEQQRLLLGELVRAEQAERQRIAADVHDDSVQLLAAAQLRLQLLDNQLVQLGAEPARQSVANLHELVFGALQRLRQLLVELEPPEQLRDRLDQAVAQTARRLFDGTEVAVEVRGALRDVTPEAAAVLHRAAGEALSNARRHSGAGQVTVLLEQDATTWRMVVEDDGAGIASDRAPRAGHLGIRGMTSRVEALGGSCVVTRRDAGGTRVEIRLPVPDEPVSVDL